MSHYLRGDAWHRARLAKGHEAVLVPGTQRRLPKLRDEPEHVELCCVDMEDRDAADALDDVESDISDRVRSCLSHLSTRERRIIDRRYGFDCEPQPLDKIGYEMDITRDRVRQLEQEALSLIAYYLTKFVTDRRMSDSVSHNLQRLQQRKLYGRLR